MAGALLSDARRQRTCSVLAAAIRLVRTHGLRINKAGGQQAVIGVRGHAMAEELC
jgi:hypothetical protein